LTKRCSLSPEDELGAAELLWALSKAIFLQKKPASDASQQEEDLADP
jgi:hypothetical protein